MVAHLVVGRCVLLGGRKEGRNKESVEKLCRDSRYSSAA